MPLEEDDLHRFGSGASSRRWFSVGPINDQAFAACVAQFHAPTLSPGDIVVMANLSSHKKPKVRAR
jgi:hypothetical protein